MWLLKYFCLVLLFYGAKAQRRPAICKSPNGEKGTCVPFLECELFKKLLENGANKLSDKQKQFLRASECKQRKDGQFPMSCCGTATNFKD
ncbi:hypothetical protein YQE_00601, partial [Dendroctonus ponderosae]